MTLEIRAGKILKIIFLAIIIFGFSGMILAIMQNKLELMFYLVMTIVVMRFVFLELGFRLVSKFARNKLTEIIEIKIKSF